MRASHLGGLAVLAAAALLYLLTLDNGLRPEELSGGDLITHQYAQVEGRPSNAPGYPLYTMGGWLWFRLGRAGLSWALNPIEILSLYSTLWGLASLGVLYLILNRVAPGGWPAAALLTAFYAVTYFFWYYSVTTEQYTSAVFQTLLVIWLAFTWDDRPRASLLLWLAFITGTMLANMVTTLFILPPLLWFILFRPAGDRDRLTLSPARLIGYLKSPRLALAAVGLAILPLLSYAYVYIRGAQHPEWRGAGTWPSTWAWFVEFLSIRQGRDELAPGLSLSSFFTGEFPALMWQELTWPVFWGGLAGLIFLGRRRALFLYATLLIYLIFCWAYRAGNWFQVIIPAYPIFIIGFAALLHRIGEDANQRMANTRIRRTGSNTNNRSPSPIRHSLFTIHYSLFTIIILAGLLLYRFIFSLPEANQQNRPEDTGLDPGWILLADRPDAPAVVAGNFEERVALQYLHTVWQAAPQVYPVDTDDLPPAISAGADGLSAYVSRRAASLAPQVLSGPVHPQATGEELIGLWRSPRERLPAGAAPLSLAFGESLRLVGRELPETGYPFPPQVAARLSRANWQLALYWQAEQPLPEDYTISVRPLVGGQLITNQAREVVIQDHQPVWGTYPTGRWQPGELVRDVYALSLPTGANPDAVQVVVYRLTADGFENLAEQTIELDKP